MATARATMVAAPRSRTGVISFLPSSNATNAAANSTRTVRPNGEKKGNLRELPAIPTRTPDSVVRGPGATCDRPTYAVKSVRRQMDSQEKSAVGENAKKCDLAP